MQQLQPSGFPAVAPLFRNLSLLHGSVRAVLHDPSLGQIWINDPKAPEQAILRGPEGMYLAGNPGLGLSELKDTLADWDYLYPDAQWLPVVNDVLPNRFMIAHDRMRLALETRPTLSSKVPDNLEVIVSSDTLETSIEHAGQIISRCTVDMAVNGYAEFGIWTHQAHQGRGLAKVAAYSSIVRAIEQGITSFGWHCHASNTRSLGVATSLGFRVTDHYQAYSASLPAENDGDLEVARCLDLAVHFDAGASEMSWLNYHAAAGWALAGELGKALSAVERLVAQKWNGKAEWLEAHWAFEKIRADPRFLAAVEIQRKAH